ncbi:TIR domain-containing protein [Stenotrophomonas sp. BSUC-16]|uniref:TIR domain-containing protein n=1 Tax=Stenotrophomonas sp. BSUC-16 TaxID=3156074 RepID=UPI0033915CCE
MTHKVFYRFNYKRDGWRASKVRNIGVVEGNPPTSDNKWEEVLRGGDAGIQRWIDVQLENRSCTIVLIGTETANRRWVKYEIEKSWKSGKALFGIRIHKLPDHNQQTSIAGANPFDDSGSQSIRWIFYERWAQDIHSRQSLRPPLHIQY